MSNRSLAAGQGTSGIRPIPAFVKAGQEMEEVAAELEEAMALIERANQIMDGARQKLWKIGVEARSHDEYEIEDSVRRVLLTSTSTEWRLGGTYLRDVVNSAKTEAAVLKASLR